jgi:hypothetical protein
MRRTRVSRTLATDRQNGLFTSLFLIALASCGGTNRTPVRSENNSAPTWPTLSWEDRHDVMTFTVQPNMGRAWQDFTKSDAPTMTCRTCHGANAEDVDYKMPNPKLPPLDPANMPRKNSSSTREAKYTTFMTDVVVPKMIFLIDAPPSFGCFNCHTKKS